MAYDWDRNERDGRFDELAAGLIFFTIITSFWRQLIS